MLRELKSKPHRIEGFFITSDEDIISFRTENGEKHEINPIELPVSDRYSNGSFVIDSDNHGEIDSVWKEAKYEAPYEN